ncbi:MAG TPA: cytochrome oxidase small assembly protein [Burkholderiaceae bacterium]|jgi:hypothetical protein|nr:cytochrome oxidase small assembly protein [Burkholderiaceae bacterium]
MANATPAAKKNARTALVLASIALVFFLGIVARYWLLGT